MFDRTGQKCAFCHTPFEPGDDVVVCPDCGAPYHRDCYAKAGECVFTDKHGSGFEWEPEPGAKPLTTAGEGAQPAQADAPAAPPVFAEHPGQPPQQAFQQAPSQQHSGSASSPEEKQAWAWSMGFLAESMDPESEMDGIPLKEWAAFVGRSAPYYLTVFQQMQRNGGKGRFSLSALFFGSPYFFYRKMWKWGFIFLALECVGMLPNLLSMLVASGSAVTAGLTLEALQPFGLVLSIVNLAVAFIRGFIACPKYYKQCKQRIDMVREKVPAGPQRYQVLTSMGGTNLIMAILLALVQSFAMSLLVVNLAGPALMSALYM